jgi:hypothetical protein
MLMQRSASKWFAIALLSIAAVGCADEGVGDPCVPEAIPFNPKLQNTASGGYGFSASETYLETSSVQCKSRVCIVHKLDNGSTTVPADPRNHLCDDPLVTNKEGCVSNDALAKSVYCTCKCGGPKLSELCECPSGFSCTEVQGLDRGGDGVRGNYCLKSGT